MTLPIDTHATDRPLGPVDDLPDPERVDTLPSLPGVAPALLKMCDDPRAGVAAVAEVAQLDPALVARMLQVVNSPFYAPREPVTDLLRAAAFMGLQSVKLIALGFSIVGDLWDEQDENGPLSRIVGASIMAGSGARSFSVTFGTGRDDESLTSGILSYVGDLTLLHREREKVTALWSEADGLPSREAQQDVLGTDGVELGLELLDRWGLPEGLRAGVEARDSDLGHRTRREQPVFNASLGFGTAIADLLLAGEEPVEVLEPLARPWGLDHTSLLDYWSDFRSAVRQTTRMLKVENAAELDDMITHAREQYLASNIHSATQLDAAQGRIDQLEAENLRLEGLAMTDPLTGAPNRAAFMSFLRNRMAAAQRHGGTVGLVLFDLDHFKAANDRHGHATGDDLLRLITNAALEAARTDELFARIGGDEFALVTEATDPEELRAAAERLRLVMGGAAARVPFDPPVTVCAGAELINPGDDLERSLDQLFQSADDALYRAKRTGRDRTASASHGR